MSGSLGTSGEPAHPAWRQISVPADLDGPNYWESEGVVAPTMTFGSGMGGVVTRKVVKSLAFGGDGSVW